MIRNCFPIVGLALMALLLISCKPTEKNYRSAYDKAYEASLKKAESETESVDGNRMESINGPQMKVFDGDTIYVSSTRVSPFESTLPAANGKTGIAVAHYKMPTNARKHVADLSGEYPDAFMAKSGENYFVIIGIASTPSEAAQIISLFKKNHPDYHYIGLNPGPQTVIIF